MTGTETSRIFPGLTHAQVLEREVPATRQLVTDLIEAGTLGTIAALPETHKSFLASEIGHKVAGGGLVLGRFDVVTRGPVGYWWQDDSEANEVARVKDYASRHSFGADLPIRWHLNEGLRLPDDIDWLRGEIEHEEQVLVVLDSLYNFLPGLNLKDEDVAIVLAAVKAGVCDPTGCAVCFVDHAPWPTEGNHGQRRGYGSVFKAAVIRWGIYLDRQGEKLYVEARGNNLRGLERTLATWDAEALELRLLEVERVDEPELDIRVLEYVTEHPGEPTKQAEEMVKAGRESIRKSLERLAANRLVATGPGRHPSGKYWYPANHAALVSPGDTQATLGDMDSGASRAQVVARPPFTPVGGGDRGDTLCESENTNGTRAVPEGADQTEGVEG